MLRAWVLSLSLLMPASTSTAHGPVVWNSCPAKQQPKSSWADPVHQDMLPSAMAFAHCSAHTIKKGRRRVVSGFVRDLCGMRSQALDDKHQPFLRSPGATLMLASPVPLPL